jgi:hypothetical protein
LGFAVADRGHLPDATSLIMLHEHKEIFGFDAQSATDPKRAFPGNSDGAKFKAHGK